LSIFWHLGTRVLALLRTVWQLGTSLV